MLEMLFKQCGAEIRAAAGASEALEAFERWRPDVMVCDIGMREEDGYSLIREVRAAEGAQADRTPAVALTRYVRSEDRAKALSAGYQMHVAKPIDPLELTEVVARLAGKVPAG